MRPAIELLLFGTSPARVAHIAKRLENHPGCHLQATTNLADIRARSFKIPADRLVVLALQTDQQTLSLLEPHADAPRFAMLLLIERDDTLATVEAIKAGVINVLVESPDTLDRLPETIDATLTEWQRRHARQVAFDHAARFGQILASALTEIYTFDAETLHYLRVNRGARENTGYSAQELSKMTPLDLMPNLRREQFEDLLLPLRTGIKEAIRFETVHRRKNDSRYPVEVQLQFGQGEPTVFVAVILDISERKQAEKNLRAGEARFRSIFDTAAAGMAILTPYGDILEVNPYFCEFIGFSSEELIGRNIEDVTHPDDRGPTADYYTALRQGRDPMVNIEKRYLRKDGQVRWGHASVACVFGRDRSETYCVGLVQDITRHKETETRMQEAYAELDAFVHTVAHDLRTPLTPIIGMAEFLRTHASGVLDRTALDFLADIEASGYRMLALLEDLLVLARVGHIRQPATPIDTRRVVHEVLMNLAGPLSTAKSKVEVGELSPLCLPETQINQLFANLIGNALRYAGTTGKPIEVGEEQKDGQLIIYVRDHGPGIPDDEVKHIFEVFFRGEGAKQIKGTGVGLATVRKIARLYNGEVRFEATPGGGSTFRLEFPLATLSCGTDDGSSD